MGREIRRVPLDFNCPIDATWPGYLMPPELCAADCPACDRSGLNPATHQLSKDWYDLGGFEVVGFSKHLVHMTDAQIIAALHRRGARWTYRYGVGLDGAHAERSPWKVVGDCLKWQHSLTQDEVDALVEHGRLHDFTHTWARGEGWKQKDPPHHPTAEEVNRWSHYGAGHDGINQWICLEVRARRLGIWGRCETCGGEGEIWARGQKEAHEAWKKTEPPTGPAYQIWQTVSEGGPVSPPFLEPEDLARWMVQNDRSIHRDTTYDGWLKFIREEGHAPSMISSDTGVQSGTAAFYNENGEEAE